MKARVCDICGEIIQGGAITHNSNKPPMTIKVKRKDADGNYKKLELCSACMYNLINYCRKHRGDADVDYK